MEKYRLGEMEEKFAELIWEREPVGSGELVKVCEKGTFRLAFEACSSFFGG